MMNDWLLRMLKIGFGVVLGVSALAVPSRAELVTYNFTGTINVLNDSNDWLGGQVNLGDQFSGTLIYDTSTAKLSGTTPIFSGYAYQNLGADRRFVSPIGITAQVGSYSVAPNYVFGDMYLAVFNNAPTTFGGVGDGFSAQQNDSVLRGNQRHLLAYEIFLGDLGASAYSSTALPTSISTSSFTDGTFSLVEYVPGSSGLVPVVVFQGTIDGLRAVPEPSSLILCGLAVPALLLAQRRRLAA